MTNSVRSRKSGKPVLSTMILSMPVPFGPVILFNDRKIRKMIMPSERLCRIPKIQNNDFFMTSIN